ncbi:MAG TPA: hypothetical protein VMT70_12170 [Vicinamibacteria bacterium]|nr:hypothetical protein [Vicinamibacteria bacterium]
MRRNEFVGSLLVCAVAWMAGSSAVAGENWVGTWKLNAAKSRQASASVRAQALRFEATPAGIKLTSDGTDAQGMPMHGGYTSKFDGKDVPWEGNPSADTASPKRIDDNSYENVWKKGGKAVVTATVSVSKDGKTLTVTQSGTDAQGSPFKSVAVYDRQ